RRTALVRPRGHGDSRCAAGNPATVQSAASMDWPHPRGRGSHRLRTRDRGDSPPFLARSALRVLAVRTDTRSEPGQRARPRRPAFARHGAAVLLTDDQDADSAAVPGPGAIPRLAVAILDSRPSLAGAAVLRTRGTGQPLVPQLSLQRAALGHLRARNDRWGRP